MSLLLTDNASPGSSDGVDAGISSGRGEGYGKLVISVENALYLKNGLS